jgi:FkbM family methyltransferase
MKRSELNKKMFSTLRFIYKIGLLKSVLIGLAMSTAGAEYEVEWKGRKVHMRKGTSDFKVFKQVMAFGQYNYRGLNGRPVETIIDLGANIGLSAVYFKTKYPNAQVIAVEPEVHNYDLMVKNISGFKNVHSLCNAIWYEDKDLGIFDAGRGEYGFRVVEPQGNQVGTTAGITISDIVKKYNLQSIDILKVDIEGAEKELFTYNYKEWLPKVKCIMIELHDGDHPGCTPAFFRAIADRDFIMFCHGENVIIKFNDTKSAVA